MPVEEIILQSNWISVLRILVITQEYFPSGSGIAVVAHNVVKQLISRDHEVTVVSNKHGDIILNLEKIISRFAILGLIYFWYKAKKFIKNNSSKYDVIWLHNPLIIGGYDDCKSVSTIHTTYLGYFESFKDDRLMLRVYYRIAKWVESICLSRLQTQISAISSQVSDEVRRLVKKVDYIHLIQNGVDHQQFHIKDASIRSTGTIKAICVGRVNAIKKPITMIQFWKQFSVHSVGSSLTWAGHGDLLETCRRLCSTEDLRQIKFLGFVEHSKLSELYNDNQFFIMSSRYEALSLFRQV